MLPVVGYGGNCIVPRVWLGLSGGAPRMKWHEKLSPATVHVHADFVEPDYVPVWSRG